MDAAIEMTDNLRTKPDSALTSLVIVCGHGVFKPDTMSADNLRDAGSWEPKRPDQVRFYVDHVQWSRKVAIDYGADSTLIIFSGGATREVPRGPKSEANCYYRIADTFLKHTDVKMATEPFARDSLENVLFSLARFHQLARRFPSRIAVISFAVKGARFELHRDDLGIVSTAFDFLGIGNPAGYTDAQCRENDAVAEYQEDPYGTKGDSAKKRRRRDPYGVSTRDRPYKDTPRYPYFPETEQLWKCLVDR